MLYIPAQCVPLMYQKMYLDYDNTILPLPDLQTTVCLKDLGLPYKRARLEYWANKPNERARAEKENDKNNVARVLKTINKFHNKHGRYPYVLEYVKQSKILKQTGKKRLPSITVIVRLFGSWNNAKHEASLFANR